MNMKYMDIPSYESVDVVAKTVDTVTGTIDRKKVGRCLVTEAAGFAGKHQVVDGDGTPIVTAAAIGEGEGKVPEVELFVELVGGKRSLASFKFFEGWTADNRENAGVKDLFTVDGEQVSRLVGCAERMCCAAPECDGQWKIADKDGNRWFLRMVDTGLTPTGRRNG